MLCTRLSAVSLTLLALFALPAGAQNAKGKGARIDVATASVKKPSDKKPEAKGSDVEIRIIHDYFASQSRKPKPLPPGIAKNLARGKPIPPGIAKTRMPDDLQARLPKREGSRWIILGDRVVLVDVGGIVLDIVRAVF